MTILETIKYLLSLCLNPFKKRYYDWLLEYHYNGYHDSMLIDINEVLPKPGQFPVRVIYHRHKFNQALQRRMELGPTKWKPLAGV